MSILNEHELERKIVSTIKERIQDSLDQRREERKTQKKFQKEERKQIRDAKDLDVRKKRKEQVLVDLMHIQED